MKKEKKNNQEVVEAQDQNQQTTSTQSTSMPQNLGAAEYDIVVSKIELTNLNPTTNLQEIKELCQMAIDYGFYGVCVHPMYVRNVFKFLKKHRDIQIASVVGYPLGENLLATKLFELKEAFAAGANIVDVYFANSLVKNNNLKMIKKHIKQISKQVKAKKNRLVRIVLDNRYLDIAEMHIICKLCVDFNLPYITITEGVTSPKLNFAMVQQLCDEFANKIKIKLNYNVKTQAELQNPAFAKVDVFATKYGQQIAEEIIQKHKLR